MKKNIFITFLSYMIINIICYLTFLFVAAPIIDIYPSIYLQFAVGVIHILFVGFLYYLAGKKYLISTGNKFVDFVSVWWVSFFLLAYNILAYWVVGSGKLEDIGFFINSISMSVLFSFVALFQELYDIEPSYFVVLLPPLIPSLGLWLGLIVKKIKQKKTHQQVINQSCLHTDKE